MWPVILNKSDKNEEMLDNNYIKGSNILFTCRDLKRDVAKKLEKLEKRTQKAIVELIRECQNIIL